MAFLRDVWVVARHELAYSARRRRAAVLLLLYLLAGVAGANLFVTVLNRIEDQLAESMRIERTPTGSTTAALWQSRPFRRILTRLVGDNALAKSLLSVPPLALWYGWFSLMVSPLLAVLLCAPAIAEETGSGSARFMMFRTSRAAWCAGKTMGQAALLLAGLVLSAAGAWCVGNLRMASFASAAGARAMLVFAFRGWLYTLAFLGLAMGVSQMTRSAHKATGFGLVALVVFAALAAAARRYSGPGWRRGWDLLEMLIPQGHRLDLWYPDLSHQLPAVVFLAGLGWLYFLIGHFLFARRDL
ncbi:MAG: ABC transporter permease subunit [Kiritimatiellae bacterium]|nr:ABC transporter permease subunit [Kiritimatiellia bacterium]